MKNRLSCIIVEDERPAQEVLRTFISRVNTVDLVAVFDDALAAFDFLKIHDVDVMFLDIQLPALSGVDLLKILKNPPQVVFTSAYSQYALDAFDLDVRDYLMKPISFERFVKSLGKVAPKPAISDISYLQSEPVPHSNPSSFAFFNMNKTKIKVRFHDILYVESMREYIYIHTDTGNVMTKMSMLEIETILRHDFLRCHRSFLVNIQKISAYTAEEIIVGKKAVPIGISYKRIVETLLSRLTIS